jgi:predicted RNase H-like nuclease
MQPANVGRVDMFGPNAPVWPFLDAFGGAALIPALDAPTVVIETYPVLTLIALGWLLPDTRPAGRLPKYNPERRSTFALADWQYVCEAAANALGARGLDAGAAYLRRAAAHTRPQKRDQDALDAPLCLLAGLHVAAGDECLMVGDLESGYIVVPHAAPLHTELARRFHVTGRDPRRWLTRWRAV